ncbi:oligopeptide ABC transporter ATP-binding protein, partial [Mesorhizobium sp. M7A.F.Ca.CA.001.07.2.1]
ERCRNEVPPLVPMADGRVVACHVRAPARAASPKPAEAVKSSLFL